MGYLRGEKTPIFLFNAYSPLEMHFLWLKHVWKHVETRCQQIDCNKIGISLQSEVIRCDVLVSTSVFINNCSLLCDRFVCLLFWRFDVRWLYLQIVIAYVSCCKQCCYAYSWLLIIESLIYVILKIRINKYDWDKM